MNLSIITRIPRLLGAKIPEIPLKEEIVRFLAEPTTERIIEIPLVLNNIPKKKSKILDIGCRYSLLPIQLASLGHKTFGIDINEYHRKHKNFSFTLGDVRESPYKNSFFDYVISLSTIEHIGLNYYGDKKGGDGDAATVNEIYRILRPGGKFLMTAPFGKVKDSSWYRVYSKKRINNLFKQFKILKLLTFREIDGNWIPVPIKDAESIDCSKKVSAMFYVEVEKERAVNSQHEH